MRERRPGRLRWAAFVLLLGAPRLNEKSLLELPVRRKIYQVIKRHPGIKISDVCRQTHAGWGTVQYHLYVLSRANLIQHHATARDCLLFSSDFPADQRPVAEALRLGRAERVARAILQFPGFPQKVLCARVRMTRRIFRRYVKVLASAGLITEVRESKYQLYFPAPPLVELLGDGAPSLGTPASPGPLAPSSSPPTL